MLHVAWKERYKVNHPLIDSQHQKLVSIINELVRISTRRSPGATVAELFKELIDYARTHFKTEETLLEAVDYPYLSQQKEAHRAYISKLISLNEHYDAEDETMLNEMILFLKKWYVNHIMQMDQQYAAYLPPSHQ